jgi:hypothetical protein
MLVNNEHDGATQQSSLARTRNRYLESDRSLEYDRSGLGSQALAGHLVACELTPEVYADLDHLPICTLIDIAAPAAEAPKRRNWKVMDERS